MGKSFVSLIMQTLQNKYAVSLRVLGVLIGHFFRLVFTDNATLDNGRTTFHERQIFFLSTP